MDDFVDARDGRGVGLVDVAVQAGVGDHLDVVAQVVKDEDGVTEHEHRLRDALGVNGSSLDAGFEVADGVVGYVAHRAAMEAGQSVDGYELVLRHLLFHRDEGVDFHRRARWGRR